MSGHDSHIVGSQPEAGWLPPWDGALYAANTRHHRRYDARFLSTLPLQPADRVLDLGCGAGDLTATVAGLVPDGHVVGVDPQPSLLVEARTRARANQSFVEAPAQGLGDAITDDGSFDVIFSQSVLHWVPWADLLSCKSVGAPPVKRSGRSEGDNVHIMRFSRRAIRGLPPSPVRARRFSLLLGFDVLYGYVHTVAQRRQFDRESVLGWLASQAVQAYAVDLAPEQQEPFRAEVAGRVDELLRPDGTYDLTFVRLDLLAFNP